MFRMTLAAALTAAAALLFADGGYAQSNAQADAEENGIVIDLRGQARERSSNAATALLAKAAAKGQVRVIVGMDDAVEDTDDEAKERAQSARLAASQRALAQRVGVAQSDVVTYDYIPFVAMGVNAAQLRRLLADPSVIHIQENMPGKAGLNQSVPKIGAPTLWNQNIDGQGWAVAVLDTGVDKSHPMFKNKVVSEACFSNKNNAPGAQSTCPGGANQAIGPGAGVHCKPANFGQCYHGTHVAGIAAGHKPQLNGVAKDARIIAIQVFVKLNGASVTFDGDWIKGLERVYALRNQFNIGAINMSLGRGRFTGACDNESPAALAIIKKLRAARIATLVASMNDSFNGDMRLPACISAAIAVGSTTMEDKVSSFSNHALQVRHMAPGSDIRSAMPDNNYASLSGTSMATPHVAGAYALLRDRRPNATVDDIAAALECTGVNVTRAGITEKRINLIQAQNYLLNPPNTTRNFPFTSNAPGWIQNVGGWTVSGGYLHITEVSQSWKVATTTACNESLNIRANIVKEGSTIGVNGIIFKAQFSGVFVGGYFAGYNSNNNTVVVLRLDGYNLQNDSGIFEQLCSVPRAHNVNGLNLVTVQTRGGLHKVFLNNNFACQATDHTYGTGRVGVATFVTPATSAFGADFFTIDPAEVVRDAPEKETEPEDKVSGVSGPQAGSIGALLTTAR